ncbi:porin [Psychromonas sp.]|nr:porin [Psychromonas sp.]
MKKTILATALTTLFAASANAATIYEANDVTIDVFGDSEIVLLNPISKSEPFIVDIQDADFGFALGYKLSEDVVLGSTVAFGVDDASGAAQLDESYVALASEMYGTLSIGKQYTIYDESGIGNDYQFGFTAFYDQTDAGEQVIKYSIDKDVFYGAVAFLLDSGVSDTGASGFDGKIGVRFADFDLAVYHAQVEEAAGNEISNTNVELGYALTESLLLQASYGQTDNDSYTETTDTVGLAAIYQYTPKIQFAAGYANIDAAAGSANDGIENQYYVNTSYLVNDYINTYVELGGNDGDDSQLGAAAGVQVAF